MLGLYIPWFIFTNVTVSLGCGYYAGFTRMPQLFFQWLFFYFANLFFSFQTFLFLTAAMVTKASHRVYKQCLRLAANGQKTLPRSVRWKLLQILECFSSEKRIKNRFGFHCWTWFLLSGSRYVMVSGSLMFDSFKRKKYFKKNINEF